MAKNFNNHCKVWVLMQKSIAVIGGMRLYNYSHPEKYLSTLRVAILDKLAFFIGITFPSAAQTEFLPF